MLESAHMADDFGEAKMPSVLAEIFFITNPNDARWLGREAYQDGIVEGLLEGIKNFTRKNVVGKNL